MERIFFGEEQQEEDELTPSATRFDAVLTSSDWTVQTIISQVHKGNIDLNPNFQRRDAWRIKRKSELIESILLNIPIPQIVLAERKDRRGAYMVIDGKQRLLSLKQFTGNDPENAEYNNFALRNLAVRKGLNGYRYNDLLNQQDNSDDLDNFENYTIRSVVIRNWPNEDFLYLVFHRLNTGSVPLSPQELRQALHPGPFSEFVDNYSINSEQIRQILGIKQADFRMRDAELVIRYISFRNYLSEYKGNLKPLLDETTRRLNDNWDDWCDTISSQMNEFEHTLNILIQIFGEQRVFRKYNGHNYESAVNRAIYDAMTLVLCDGDVRACVEQNATDFRQEFEKLCVDDEGFRDAIEGTTKSKVAISNRVRKIASVVVSLGCDRRQVNVRLERYGIDSV